MATKRQQERKKKNKERKAKARVEARRHKLNSARREELQASKLERKFRERPNPIVKDPEAKKRAEEAASASRLKKLENNARILKALEEEYERDNERKKAINEQLEAEGHHTLKEKVEALEQKAMSSMDETEAETGRIDLSDK
jgi:hypothetical protein